MHPMPCITINKKKRKKLSDALVGARVSNKNPPATSMKGMRATPLGIFTRGFGGWDLGGWGL